MARFLRKLRLSLAAWLVELGSVGLAYRLAGLRPVMGAAKDANSAAQAWETGLSGARQKYIDGVNSVTQAPGAAAAAQVGVWAANTQAAQAKFARNVAAVGLPAWQAASVNKGADRLASGATAGMAKMTAFLQKFIPYINSAKASLPKRGTYEQNKARMIAMVDAAHKFQK